MNPTNEKILIRKAMSLLGSRTSARKKQTARANAVKARASQAAKVKKMRTALAEKIRIARAALEAQPRGGNLG
jgi:hypothetical protein